MSYPWAIPVSVDAEVSGSGNRPSVMHWDSHSELQDKIFVYTQIFLTAQLLLEASLTIKKRVVQFRSVRCSKVRVLVDMRQLVGKPRS